MDVTLRAPHGGIFVLFAVDNVLGFLIALAAGVVVGAAAVIALKSHRPDRRPTSRPSEHRTHLSPSDPTHQGAPMPSKSVVVGSAVGLHARPAAIIAEAAGGLGSEVTINGASTPARR